MTRDLITGDLDATTSKLGADMTDEQIVQLAHENGDCDAGFVTFEEDELLCFARALRARQPAAIDTEAVRCRVCNGHGYRTAMSATGEGAFNETCVYCGGTGKASLFDKEAAVTREEIERARDRVLEQSKNSLFRSGVKICAGEILSPTEPCDKPPAGWTCSRTKGHEGPCAASTSANVAQKRDDTGRLTSDYEPTPHEIKVARDAICREFGNNGTDGYYIRILKAIHGAAQSANVAQCVTCGMAVDPKCGCSLGRAASANVAQGAEAQSSMPIDEEILTELYMRAQSQSRQHWMENARIILAAPPAQTALTDDARDAARYRWLRDGEEDVFCMFGSNGTWGECGHIEIYGDRLDEHIDAALSQHKAGEQ